MTARALSDKILRNFIIIFTIYYFNGVRKLPKTIDMDDDFRGLPRHFALHNGMTVSVRCFIAISSPF